jgi:hypothetical protein
MLERFVEQLSEELELGEPLPSRGTGVYLLPLENDVSIEMGTSPSGFVLQCSFGPVPKQKCEEAYALFLEANLFGKGTYRAVLGINAAGDKITLSRCIDPQCNYRSFRDEVEDFVNAVDFWRQEALNYN